MSQTTSIVSPNVSIMPTSAVVNEKGHLVVGGSDTIDLAEKFGTPLYVLDEGTIRAAVDACVAGLSSYKNARVLYAGKAFLCVAMCHLLKKLDLGLDVVSEGELYTALKAGFSTDSIYMHGNNKSEREIEAALKCSDLKIVADNEAEIDLIALVARRLKTRAKLLMRVIPGVEVDTHEYIKTGHELSKFGVPLNQIEQIVRQIQKYPDQLELLGLHAHIGSQSHDMEPFLENIDILAEQYLMLAQRHSLNLSQLDVGGGLGITYTDADKPVPIYKWAANIAARTATAFERRNPAKPQLLIEPGRSIVGTAGVTLYRAGHTKEIPGDSAYLSVDGGMADNPRPITYQAQYTARVANRMNAPLPERPVTLVGRYCESGDIIVKGAHLNGHNGDIIAVFGTGAYNYSMASNYNRTTRPACVLVAEGRAEVIIERETNDDLVRQDRVPKRLL